MTLFLKKYAYDITHYIELIYLLESNKYKNTTNIGICLVYNGVVSTQFFIILCLSSLLVSGLLYRYKIDIIPLKTGEIK